MKQLILTLSLIFVAVELTSAAAVNMCRDLSTSEKNEIVDAHNDFRRNVIPKAANMRKMEWSKCLANVAARYLKSCPGLRHNPNRSGKCIDRRYVGENLYWHSRGIGNLTRAISLFNQEKNDYNYYTSSCTSGKQCGHYTQVVWADTNEIGCAVCKRCDRSGEILLCNYGPGGNYRGQKPYVRGKPCSRCNSAFPHCNNGLCSKTSLGIEELPKKPICVLQFSN